MEFEEIRLFCEAFVEVTLELIWVQFTVPPDQVKHLWVLEILLDKLVDQFKFTRPLPPRHKFPREKKSLETINEWQLERLNPLLFTSPCPFFYRQFLWRFRTFVVGLTLVHSLLEWVPFPSVGIGHQTEFFGWLTKKIWLRIRHLLINLRRIEGWSASIYFTDVVVALALSNVGHLFVLALRVVFLVAFKIFFRGFFV